MSMSQHADKLDYLIDGLEIIQRKRGRMVDQGDVEMLGMVIEALRAKPSDVERKSCATCKHRGDDPVDAYRYDENGDELTITYYECKRVAHGNKGYPGYEPGQKAIAVDGSGYHARLAVENDFSCNLWEAKPNNSPEPSSQGGK